MPQESRQRAGRYPEPATPVSVLLDRARAARINAPTRRIVLYVNVDPDSRIVLGRLSKKWHGVEMIIADDAHAGFQIATMRRPDLVLMDVELRDLDAATVMSRLREFPPTSLTPIVALSTDGSPERRRALLEAGASACLTRPVNLAEIQRYLGALLGVSLLTPA
ncbi:MAG TPA: response regulator [Acidimicrobiales bacterium]|nr:response regulator [Acidimicrobiales bacterium]